ncbi:coiled-coil domain-containing protein 182 [Zootoca vivipara]|uniref:coiled-coil domain-containing protein 182 n=1 Tax=Zootoca vivipara TaxID=8524 RepID=UPI00293C08C2|nr:coiled-coil domain-containing protein 182 [Zootoca vivipara]
METWRSFELVGMELGRQSQEHPPESPSGTTVLIGPAQSTSACLLSTMTSAVCTQYAVDLGRLCHDLKNTQEDMKNFQDKVTGTLVKLEGILGYLTEVVARLETRIHNVEQRLRVEEDKGTARSKVLSFLLPRENDLRKRCGIMENMFFKKWTWLEEMFQIWTKDWRNPTQFGISERGNGSLALKLGSEDQMSTEL